MFTGNSDRRGDRFNYPLYTPKCRTSDSSFILLGLYDKIKGSPTTSYLRTGTSGLLPFI